jgi:hypothetical protein
VGSDLVLEPQILAKTTAGVGGALVSPQIHLFASHRSPKLCNEHIVLPASLAVHADVGFLVFQRIDEIETRRLTALTRVHNRRDAVFCNSLAQHRDMELPVHIVRGPPSQRLAAVLVHQGNHVEKSPTHWQTN